MVIRVLMWAAANPQLQRQVTENPIARRAAPGFVEGERARDEFEAAAELDSRGGPLGIPGSAGASDLAALSVALRTSRTHLRCR